MIGINSKSPVRRRDLNDALSRIWLFLSFALLSNLLDHPDFANICLFLGSDMASYVNGTVIPVDGGWYLNTPGTALDPVLDMIAETKSK